MKKEEIIKEINKVQLDKEKFWVLGSASLVLRDILDDANDIDLAITEEEFNIINNDNIIFLGINNNTKWYRLNDIIEFCIDEKGNDKVDKNEPFNLLNLEYYYNNFLRNSTRPKDEKKKKIIEKMINNK